MLGLHWGYIRVTLGLYWAYFGVVLGKWNRKWKLMEQKMETTVFGLGFRVTLGLYWDNGKEHGNYCLGFRVTLGLY